MPAIELKLTDWPNAVGGTSTVTVTAPIDGATAGAVLTYIGAIAGFRDEDGQIVSAEQAAGDEGATQRSLEDVATGILTSLAAAYVRDAAKWAETVQRPTLQAPAEGDVTASRVDV